MTTDFETWCLTNLTIESEHDHGEITAWCPRCGKAKLAVNMVKRAWQCWSCRYAGRRPDGLVEAVTGRTSDLFTKDAALAARDTTGEIAGLSDNSARSQPRRWPTAPLPGVWGGLSDTQTRYLRHRGVPDEHLQPFGVGAVTDDGTRAGWLLAGRVVVPVMEGTRRIYWTARATLGSVVPKTLNCPATGRLEAWGLPPTPGLAGKADVLLGLHLCHPGEPVVLVEGPMDALICGAGFVATLGAGLSAAQAALLVALRPSEVITLFDPDEAGQHGADRVTGRLSGLVAMRRAQCPPGADPGDLGRAAALKHCQRARRSSSLEILSL